VFLTASFKKESELAKPELTWAGGTNLMVGVACSAKPAAAGEAKVAVAKVTGIPSNIGLKYSGGKITGVPTKACSFTATVTVVLASNKKKTWTYKVPFTVAALPDWAKGTFDGPAERTTPPDDAVSVGLAAVSVGPTGAISGQLREGGTNWTLTAKSYTVRDGDLFVSSNLVATYSWKAKEKVKGKMTTVAKSVTRKFTLCIDRSNDETAQGRAKATEQTASGGATLTAWQNLWKRGDTKASMPAFSDDIDKTLELGEAGDADNTLNLTFKKDGVVSFAGKVAGVSVSGSSQLVRCDGNNASYQMTLYAPPPKGSSAGFCKTLAVTLTVEDATNVVKDVAAEEVSD
jgi:hypothetical protein